MWKVCMWLSKKDCRQQFERLPFFSNDGETYYLDLMVWRANANLKKILLFKAFCHTLYKCFLEPALENYTG